MKNLSNYISEKLLINQQVDEKLLINKNFKNEISFCCEQPNKEGKCLVVAISTAINYNRRIDLTIQSYYDLDDPNTIHCSGGYAYEKGKNGYYFNDIHNWFIILLFKDDAKELLKELLYNPLKKFDFSEITSDKEINWPLQCHPHDGKQYSEKYIKQCLEEIE